MIQNIGIPGLILTLIIALIISALLSYQKSEEHLAQH